MNSKLPWTGERLVTEVQNATMIEHLHRYSILLNLVEKKSIVDIASGEGYGSNLLSKHASQVFGIDIDEESVNHANRKYQKANLEYKLGSATDIPIPDASIDMVVSFETLEHHDKHEEMLQEIKRILKPDGVLIMSTPEKVFPPNNPFHIKELTNNEFQELIQTHFSSSKYYFQRIVMGSLITPQDDIPIKFTFHKGNYKELNQLQGLENAIFNICIASNGKIPELGISYFEGERILIDNLLMPYKNSRLFKLSNRIKNLFNKS